MSPVLALSSDSLLECGAGVDAGAVEEEDHQDGEDGDQDVDQCDHQHLAVSDAFLLILIIISYFSEIFYKTGLAFHLVI